jgi:hypothetical protein
MKSDRLGPSSTSAVGLSKSNDDSSVVSLKALVSRTDPTLSARRAATTEDSGLIDLKKLMATAPPSSDALPPVLAPQEAGLFAVPAPNAMPAPVPSSSLADETAAPSTSRAKWFAVVSVAIMLIVGGVAIVQKREPSPPQVAQAGIVLPSNESVSPKFVEAKQPVEAQPRPETKPPAPVDTRASGSPQVSRQAAVTATSRERAGRDAPVTKRPVEEKAPAQACDLMCEMERAAKKRKAP